MGAREELGLPGVTAELGKVKDSKQHMKQRQLDQRATRVKPILAQKTRKRRAKQRRKYPETRSLCLGLADRASWEVEARGSRTT